MKSTPFPLLKEAIMYCHNPKNMSIALLLHLPKMIIPACSYFRFSKNKLHFYYCFSFALI